MTDFPWEVIKAETLRVLARELGIKRVLRREEIIAFLRAVQKRGLGPALVDEIAKDFTNSALQQDVATSSPSYPSSPVTRTKSKPSTSSRISTRKRPAPSTEPEPEPLFLADDQGEDEDAEGEPDDEEDAMPESVSTVRRNTRQRGAKRVRLSDPGPGPAKSTRSKASASTSVSAMTLRSSPRGKRVRISTRSNGSVNTKRSGRRPTGKARAEEEEEDGEDEGEDADAEGGDDVDSGEETGERFTGPSALAAALTRASTQSRTPRPRGRPSGTSRARKTTVATATRSRSAPSAKSRTRTGGSTDDVALRRPKRTIKPTMKGALLSPMSILSRPVRSQPQRQTQAQTAGRGGGRRVLAGVVPPSVPRVQVGLNGRSESPREIFDGVILKKRRVTVGSKGASDDVDHRQSLEVQLDEFVANGLERQNAQGVGNMNGMMTSDPVLGHEDASSLGGSNKENDFSFRNVSESSEDPTDCIPIGEEDAEGEPEHEHETEAATVDTGANADAVMLDLHQLQHQTDQLNLNDMQRPPLHEVSQLEPEFMQTMLAPELEFQAQYELHIQPQAESELQPEPEPQPGADLQPEAETSAEQGPVIQPPII